MDSENNSEVEEIPDKWKTPPKSPLEVPVMILGFSPFISFMCLKSLLHLRWNALISLGLAFVAISVEYAEYKIYNGKDHRIIIFPKYLSIGFVVKWVVISILGLVIDEGVLTAWQGFMVNAGILVVTVVLLILGKPYTEQYSKQKVPPGVAELPQFRRINVLTTVWWIFCYFLMTLASIIAPIYYYKHDKIKPTGFLGFMNDWGWMVFLVLGFVGMGAIIGHYKPSKKEQQSLLARRTMQ